MLAYATTSTGDQVARGAGYASGPTPHVNLFTSVDDDVPYYEWRAPVNPAASKAVLITLHGRMGRRDSPCSVPS